MQDTPKNTISFKVYGRYALFSDPVTRIGGEKFSYHVPTYEAIKGVLKSIYWKPTIVWHVDRIRVIKPIRTQTKGTKPLIWSGKKKHSLSIYTFLRDVEYQVQAHFEWNEARSELTEDRIDGKHFAIAQRSIEKGGRQDIFLGVRDCQGYVEPCEFGQGKGTYDEIDELSFGFMFHGFDYPDETGKTDEFGKPNENGEYRLHTRLWNAMMRKGVIDFPRPEDCDIRKHVRLMQPKIFNLGKNLLDVKATEILL